MSYTIINEGSTSWATITFTDQAGDPATPTTVEWRADCLTTDTTLATWAATAASSTVEITLSPAINAIQQADDPYEMRLITVKGTFGSGDESYEEYRYLVENLAKV